MQLAIYLARSPLPVPLHACMHASSELFICFIFNQAISFAEKPCYFWLYIAARVTTATTTPPFLALVST